MEDVQEKFLLQLSDDLARNRVVLPTLPEIALRVKKVVEDDNAGAGQVARVVGSDPALCTRLLKVANSAMYRGRVPADNVQAAISRLGMMQVHHVVTTLVMEQLYQAAAQKALRPHLARLWVHSTRVAAIATVLARRYTRLSADQAMLGGLIHDIGVLPILSRAEGFPTLFNDAAALAEVVADLHGDVGRTILETWHFPPEMAEAAAGHDDLERDSGPRVDLADVVQVANLLSYVGTEHPHTRTDWNTVPAFAKLGITPAVGITVLKEAEGEIREVQALLGR